MSDHSARGPLLARLKLTAFVVFVCVSLLAIGLAILLRHSGSDWLAFVFIGSAVFVAVICPYYFAVIAPMREALEKKQHDEETTSLADLIEWRITDSDFPWGIGDHIISRDWPLFLERSTLGLKSEIVDVLAEQHFTVNGSQVRLAYLRCEDTGLEKHEKVFEGWIFDVADVKEQQTFHADHKAPHPYLVAIGTTIALLAFGLLGVVVLRYWRQLIISDLMAIALIFAVVIGITAVLYSRSFTRSRWGKQRGLPKAYAGFFNSLAKSNRIEFFHFVVGPSGLLVAVQPRAESLMGEDRGLVAIESPHGDALDVLLAGIKSLPYFNDAKKTSAVS